MTSTIDDRDVLNAVAAGDAWQRPDGGSDETLAAVCGVSDPIRDITEQMQAAEQAGLVVARPLAHGPGARWELTAAGRDLLARPG